MHKNKVIKLSLLLCLLNVAQTSKPNTALKLCIAPLAGLAVHTGCKLLDKAEKEAPTKGIIFVDAKKLTPVVSAERL